jgi:TIR domain
MTRMSGTGPGTCSDTNAARGKRQMTSVFVSHSSEDNYFVDFLIELLKFHRLDVWADRTNLEAGGTFTADIEQALAACENMVVVLSQRSAKSSWITREVAHFRAVDASRPIIPLLLDGKADPDQIYEGLGLVTHLRCDESLLASMRELLRRLGRPLFPPVENRKTPDRRSSGRRGRPADRRTSSIERRLRVGLDKFVEGAGVNLLEPMARWRDVSNLARLLASGESPLRSFDYTERGSGASIVLGFDMIQTMALSSWRSKFEREPTAAGALEEWGISIARADDDMTGAAYVIDDIVDDIVSRYTVTARDRRSGERRSGSSRRKDQS